MRRDLWPLKAFFALAALFIGVADLTFPGEPTSPGILLLLAVLLAFEAANDLGMHKVEQRWADEDRAAKLAAEKAQSERQAEEWAESLKEAQRAFRAGKDLGFHLACYANNKDLLRVSSLSSELREKLEIKQREIVAGIETLSKQFDHLNVAEA